MSSDAPRKGSFIVQPQEKCTACQKTVYATEKIIVEEKDSKLPYHKTCLRCKTCNKPLALGNYSSMNGDFWCKPHFKQTFATKGNYDEAFGKESIKGKWAAAPVSTDAPKSFVPATEGGNEKPSSEKKETSAETAAKFQKWREEGESNRCAICEKAVYQAEKLVVAEKNASKIYHKTCFKCTTCNINLDVRNFGSAQGKIYCMTHLKEVNKDLQNQAAAAYVPAPTSFVPATGGEEGEKKSEPKNETSEKTAAIINKFRTEGDGNSCIQCNKTVYATERLVLEEKDSKKLMHKTCFKCSHCQKQLELGTYSSNEGIYYCKPHFKQLFAAKGNYDEGFGRERKGTGNVAYIPGQSFVPKVEEEKIQPNKKESSAETAEKFKSLGSSGNSEKCKVCGKTVYATEKIAVEELKNQTIYHKNCFRCSACNVKLDLSSYGSSAGVIYCKTHLKQLGKPEASKDVGFISPLHKPMEADSQQERDQVQSERVGEERNEDDDNNNNNNNNRNEERETERERERETEQEQSRQESNNNDRNDDEEREREERENQERREREERENQERREREQAESQRPTESASSNNTERNEDDEREREREERRKERERRKKEREEEEERAEEERKKRQEERKKRLAAMDS